MGYMIFVRTQVSPQSFPSGAINPGPAPDYPAGAAMVYRPSDLNIYSANTADRLELLSSPEGNASCLEIFAAFPKIREPKLAKIRAEGARRLSALATPYSAQERETWATQQTEAETWEANPATAVVPMLQAMATNRGITVDTLVEKILGNVELFRTIAGSILGEQQRLLDLVNDAVDYDQMQAVTW